MVMWGSECYVFGESSSSMTISEEVFVRVACVKNSCRE